jgi:uncharacterized membrane protein (DUF4010 family)
MFKELLPMVPLDALNIALVLALAFFIRLEREEHKQREAPHAFGGVRTFPLIGLVGYALALISAPQLTPWALGFAVVGATTIGVLSVILLELKKGLEGLTRHVASNEIITVAKFLVLSVVILPVVPDRDLTRFHLDPSRSG